MEHADNTRTTTRTLAFAAIILLLMLVTRWLQMPPPMAPLEGRLQINVNRASAEELSILPQVGPILARRVVEYRNQSGPFASVDDLDAVHGIGPSILTQIRPYCTVGSQQ